MNTTPLLDLLSHAALKGAAILLVALLLGLLLRRMAAARRYALWISAIATLAVLPLAMWLLPAWHVLPQAPATLDWPVMEPPMVIGQASPVLLPENDSPALPVAKPALPMPAQVAASPAFSWYPSWQEAMAALPVVWMLIAGMLLLRLGHSAWRLHRLESTLRPGECAVLDQAASELGLRCRPRLLIGPQDSVPMVWGVLNPRLLLPQGFQTWSREKQRGVLLHELAHLKRGDPLALWTAQCVKALHWFNPLVWLTLRQLRADQERACDDAVLRNGVRASDYAQSLLDLSRHNRLAPGLSLCALTITRCAPVEARVKAILDPKRSREGLTLRWLAGLAGCALLITLPVAMLHAIEGPALRGRILDRNGVVLAESTKEKVRNYPLKALAAHVVGYTRKPDEEDAKLHGGAGMEKKEDAALKAGKDVSLTLDARIQALTLQAMKDGGVERGAGVVLDPRTGEILASVSLPGYDPNLFVPSVSFQNWDHYLKDIDTPFLNRVSSSRSAPGAVFQPFTVLAALRAGKTPGTYACTPLTRGSGGGVRYGSVTRICRTSLREGAAHGQLTLEQALAKGCSSYFFQLGTEVGYPALFSMADDLGLQQGTNIFGVKSPPLLPSMEELAKTRSIQRQLNDITTDFASGRGSPATVLQMAALYSALANGKVWEPSLTKKSAGRPRLDLNTLPGMPEGLARVRSALREAVIHPQPWARSLTSSKAQIAALADSYATGAKGPHSEVFTHHYWMAGYAPADKPALAFALYVDETSPDSTPVPDKLGPMVRRVVEETLALPADGSGEVKPMEEALTTEKQAQLQFDAKADALRAIVENIKLDDATGFKVDEITVHKGQIIIHGTASGMSQALAFKEKLVSAKFDDPLEWSFPVPQTLKDGKGVEFRAQGVLIWKAEAATTPEEVKIPAKTSAAANENFDFEAAELSREIKQLADKFAVIVRESKMGGSSLTLLGDGPSANMVLSYLEKLKELGAKHQIKLEIPPPLIQQDQTARFEVHGAYGASPSNALPATDAQAPTNQAEVRQQSGDSIQMKPALANQWVVLKQAGLLAHLPAEARPFESGRIETHMKSVRQFNFTVPREAGRRWLLDSFHGSTAFARETQTWPEPPASFQRTYAASGHCMISIHCADGVNLHVQITQRKPFILIAPDESQEPRPAGKLAPEYHGKGLTQSDTTPTLDAAAQTLRPAISPQEVRQPTFRLQVRELRKQAPESLSRLKTQMPELLNRLQGELSAESEKELRRSLGTGSRMQQALWVRAP